MHQFVAGRREKQSMTLNSVGLLFFCLYVSLFVALSILVKLSQHEGTGYSYNTTLAVLVVEFVKLVAASTMTICSYSASNIISTIKTNKRLALLYFVPAILYAFHNNLMFVSIKYLDPATYYVLLQFRVILTGVLFQFLFRKYLNRLQWLALLILFFGCLLKEVDRNLVQRDATTVGMMRTWVIFVVLFQVLCSCGAAVYTEFLLKTEAAKANVHLQNMFMYVDSLLCNIIALVLRAPFDSKRTSILSLHDVMNLMQPYVIAIILVSAAGGLSTAFLLKYLDSVLKVYANSFEIVLTAILSYYLLGVKISAISYVSLVIVTLSLFLYRRFSTPSEPSVPTNTEKTAPV